MILKGQPISFDKKNLPPYIYKFNVALTVFFALAIAVFLAAGIPIGLTLGDDPTMYFTLAFLAVFLIVTLIFIIIGMRLRERLIAERTAEIEKEFADMPLEEATQKLIEKGIITESGFIANDDNCIFGNTVIPFEKVKCSVYAQLFVLKWHKVAQVWTRPSHIDVLLCVHSAENEIVEFEDEYPLDGALFNFLDKRGMITDYEENIDFALLKSNKKNFVRRALGFKMK